MSRLTDRVRDIINDTSPQNEWSEGVRRYALGLIDEVAEGVDGGWMYEDDFGSPKIVHKMLLNGAANWMQYSYSGCALIKDSAIRNRLGSKREYESWLDAQARALYGAEIVATEAMRKAWEEREAE